jgi:multiple sugar transport system substrate-binding protein
MVTTLKFWLMPNAGFESKATIEREIEVFHTLYPEIEIQLEILTWSRGWFKFIQAIKDKSGPDILQVGTTWIATLGYLGAIRRLDTKKINTTHFIPNLLATCRYQKHLWAIPWFCDGRAFFYRKDYLEKAGVSLVDIDNWKSFREACVKLGKLRTPDGRPVSPLGFSSHKEQVILQDIACWIWGNGGNFLSPDGKHSALTLPETMNGFSFLLDLMANRCISEMSLEQSTGETAESFFRHDEYAFFLANSWPLQVYLNPVSKRFIGKQKAKQFDMALLPSGPAGRFNFSGGSALAITSFSSYPDEAWTFLEYMTGKDSMTRYCRNINMLPGRQDVPAVLPEGEKYQAIFHEAITRYGHSFPAHPLWGSIEQIMLNGLSHSLREFRQSDYNREGFFQNLSEIHHEIENILSVFGD